MSRSPNVQTSKLRFWDRGIGAIEEAAEPRKRKRQSCGMWRFLIVRNDSVNHGYGNDSVFFVFNVCFYFFIFYIVFQGVIPFLQFLRLILSRSFAEWPCKSKNISMPFTGSGLSPWLNNGDKK